MLKKYNELLEMLESKYKVDRFCDLGEESCYISSKNNYIASVYIESDYIQIFIDEKQEDEWYTIESRNYKNIKYAYNFIKRFLEDN